MNKILTVVATVCLLAISCRKAIDGPAPADLPILRSTNSVSAPLEKRFMVNARDTVILKLVMEPVVICYSYNTGETPKPCDIFIVFTCTLSQPVNGYVKVDIQQKNQIAFTDPKPEGVKNEAAIVFNITPNTTKFTYRSTLQNNNNIAVAENHFSIENVTFYSKVD
jgi:hypothetical protein